MNPQLQNWQNFCQHQAGNWHGFWTRYNSEREETESFQCIRSLQVKENGDKIEHQNQYKYQDGMQETKTFGPYIKPLTKALFLMQGFSWGSQEIKSETKFFFETGFRYQNRRASLGVVYNENHELEKITVISEHQDNWMQVPVSASPTPKICSGWQGHARSITPDYIVSSSVTINWNRLESLASNNATWHLNDGISVSFPRSIEFGEEFILATDWLVDSNVLYRGIRFFARSGFTHFSQAVFSNLE